MAAGTYICPVGLAGLTKNCWGNVGGIETAWIRAFDDEKQPVLDTTGEEISTIQNASTYYRYDFNKNTGSMTSTLNRDVANDIAYVDTELVLQFNHMEATKRIEVQALALGELSAIVKDCNGEFFYLGYDNPVHASAGTGQTGQNKTDSNNYTITLFDEAKQFPYPIAKSATTDLP